MQAVVCKVDRSWRRKGAERRGKGRRWYRYLDKLNSGGVLYKCTQQQEPEMGRRACWRKAVRRLGMAIGDRSEQEVSYEEKLRTDNRAIPYAYVL